MTNDLWGVAAELGLAMPSGVWGYGLLAVYLLVLLALLYYFRSGLKRLNGAKWVQLAALSLAALLLSQLFPLHPSWLATNFPALAARQHLTLLAPLPYLLAGAMFNPAAALLVGLFGGLGHALGESHHLYDIFHVGFAACLASFLMRQPSVGRLHSALRYPLIAALAQATMAVGAGMAAAVSAQTGFLAAIDVALVHFWGHLPSLLIEGLVNGLLLHLILQVMPQWRPKLTRIPSAAQRSLDQHLRFNFISFASILLLLSIAMVAALSARAARNRLIEQMRYSTDSVIVALPQLSRDLQMTLAQYGGAGMPTDEPAEKRELGRVAGLSSQFNDILLVRPNGEIVANGETTSGLTEREQTAVDEARRIGLPRFAPTGSDATPLSIVVPVQRSGGRNMLVGRIATSETDDILARLANAGPGEGVASGAVQENNSNQMLLRVGEGIPATWRAPSNPYYLTPSKNATDGIAYQEFNPLTAERTYNYYRLNAEPNWIVVTSVPYTVVLGQVLGIVLPVAGLLLVVTAIFSMRFSRLGRNLSEPIGKLIDKSKAITAAAATSAPAVPPVETAVRGERADEIGQLNVAFAQMQRALKQRLDELTLLLNVSHAIASTVDIQQGMPAILQGILRGTGAAGSRAVVRNPNASYPLIFAEGPAAENLAALDRLLMNQVRQLDELALSKPEEIQATLGIEKPPVAALFAIPLRAQDKLQGVLYLGYRQPHYFDQSERNLLHTLAGQATILVENAQLYAAAEGGRRRLATILASTSNAVVVTDQSDRVLYLNTAMEKAFGLSAAAAVGHPITSVPLPPQLTEMLAVAEEQPSRLELELGDRTFLADASTIIDRNGLILGRMAVLHDVTHFKEVDRLKSDFLTGVSHDLRSPLTVMQNNVTSLLELDELPEGPRGRVQKIQTSIDQMTKMVDDVIALAQIEAGVGFDYHDIRIESVLREAADEQRPFAQQAGMELAVETTADLPLVRADHNMVKRAVGNLLSNGVKYAPNSGRLLLRAEPQNGEVVISVQDRGPGILPEEQLRLFEKFYRAERPGIKRIKGSGLGLALVKSIAEQHGGRAWCHSQPGQGSTFYIALPSRETRTTPN